MDLVVLVSTFHRMKKYAPAIEAAIDCCWPVHPSICFISDCELIGIKKQLCFVNACWTEILLCGLLKLKKEYPRITHVFHMLDDHCPLRPCDTEAISAYLEIARGHRLSVISFPTYTWPWDQIMDNPESLVPTWRKVEVNIVQGRRLAVVSRNFFRYFQVQPAWWNLDYLLDACNAALHKGIRDPWAFEAMRWEGASQHYIADCNWPSVHHGFMAAGTVNHVAISYMSRATAAELHAELITDVVGTNSLALYEMVRWAAKTWGYARQMGNSIRHRTAIFGHRR